VNALLKPIETRCAERPEWDNTNVRFIGSWINANLAKLKGYYTAIGGRLAQDSDPPLVAQGRSDKFMAFVRVQWDLARERSMH
jgi:hypothetical protein